MIHLDTHVVAWLWAGEDRRLKRVRKTLEGNDLVISAMVLLELQALYELGRTREPGGAVVAGLTERIGLSVSPESFTNVVQRAADLGWTRDPFDRLIVANAITDGARLLTVDENIQEHFPNAFWG